MGDGALGSLLVLSQVVLSLQLGFAVIPLIHFTSDKTTMKGFAIRPWMRALAWLSASVIVYLNFRLVMDQIGGWIDAAGDYAFLVYGLEIPLVVACMLLLIYITVLPFVKKTAPEKQQVPHGQALAISDPAHPQYRHIGIAIDFSGNDQKVISNALSQGGRTAMYTFIHVVETAGARYYGSNIHDKETRLDEENLKKYVENVTEMGYSADYRVGFGQPADAIAQTVTENQIDFLVMGSHGHRGLKDWLFGTTINSVRHRVSVPVLIVNV